MVDSVSFTLIAFTTFCFGLIVSFQIAHMHYCRKLITLLRRSISAGTLAPVLSESEALQRK